MAIDLNNKILCVNAVDMPPEVKKWCIERQITIWESDVVYIPNDPENPFAKWLKDNGYQFKSTAGDRIAIDS